MGVRSRVIRGLADLLRVKYNPAVIERTLRGDSYGGGVGFYDMSFSNQYKRNIWVYICTKIISQNIAQLPLEAMSRTMTQGKPTVARLGPEHFLQDLLFRPNAFMGSFTMKFLTLAHLELTGDAFWYLGRLSGGKVGSIQVLRPTRVTVVAGEPGEDMVKGYLYRGGDEEIPLDVEDVIHFKYPNPNDDFRGQSTLEAALDTMLEEQGAHKYAKSFFENSAIPKGGVKFDHALDDSDYARIRSNWQKNHGGPDKAHRIAIFEKGGSWMNIGLTQKEMDFIEQRKMGRDNLAAAYGIPPVLYNVYERATYNNADRQVRFFWHETAIPKTVLVSETLNNDAWKFFGTNPLAVEAKRTFFAFDLSKNWALRGEALERAKSQVELIKVGKITANEARAEDNQDPTDWGDKWYRPSGWVPWDTPAPGAQVPNPVKSIVYHQADPLEALEALGRSDEGPEIKAIEGPTRPEIRVKDLGREYRLLEWKGFVIQTDYFEKIFAGYVSRLMKDQLDEIRRNLRKRGARIPKSLTTKRKPTKGEIDSILFDLEKAQKIAAETSRPLYEKQVQAAGNRAFALAGTPGTFDLRDPVAAKHMAKKIQKFALKVADTTWNEARIELAVGIDKGATINELADIVSDYFLDRLSDKTTISRTEVLGSMNGGLHDGYAQGGVKTKTWGAAGNARPSHLHADGTKKDLKESFTLENRDGSRSRVMYPGDPDGAAWAIINCRCTLFPGTRA